MPNQSFLVFIHGMVDAPGPASHRPEYEDLLRRLKDDHHHGQAITNFIGDRVCFVEWGHPDLDGSEGHPDQHISGAEQTIWERCAYQNVERDSSPYNHLHVGSEAIGDWFARQTIRPVFRTVKDQVGIFGLTDVVYYCSTEGEAAVRETVYRQVLECLEQAGAEHGAKLHVIGHSLGCTVAFDFLFGLFNTIKEPDLIQPEYPATQSVKQKYEKYRRLAQAGTVELGSFATTAPQLAWLVMRKQSLVDTLEQGGQIDTSQIGIVPQGPPQWYSFYDQDDVLGLPLRRLFNATSAIEEFEVNTGWRPDLAHSSYWSNPDVTSRIAELLASHMP